MSGNYRGVPNLVQLGINDTPLTSALDRGDFKAAEKLILENQEPSYLDEGPFEKIPLTLVLSNETEFRKHRRHLRLAKLMVEGGANPNIRIPQDEWQEAVSNPSPMEYLVELYDSVLDLCRQQSSYEKAEEEDCDKVSSLEDDNSYDEIDPLFTIGLHDEINLTPPELREQLLELLDIFLAYGGNPNVRTTISKSTLFHIAVSNPDPDMELVMKLCEAGGDLNLKNVHESTPLMDLISYAEADLSMNILRSIWKIKPDISSLQDKNCSNETALWIAMQAGSPEVAIELLQKGASPVPRSFVTIGKWHRPRRSEKLTTSREVALNGVSSIFAPLLQDSSPNLRYTSVYTSKKLDEDQQIRPFNVCLLDKVFSSTIFPVVDALPAMQCFPESVLQEIKWVVSDETNFKPESLLTTAFRPQDLALLIFGKLSAGLQQMCVRVIMNTIFISQDARKTLTFISKLNGKNIVSQEEMSNKMEDDVNSETWEEEEDDDDDDDDDEDDGKLNECLIEDTEDMGNAENANQEVRNIEQKESQNMAVEIVKNENNTDFIIVQDLNDITHWNVIIELDRTVIQKLVEEHLNLPGSLITRFIAEAIRLQLGAALYVFEGTDCIQNCDDLSDMSTELYDQDLSDEGEESGWSADFMSSDEFDSDMEWESGEEEEDEEQEEEEEEENDDDNDDDGGGGGGGGDQIIISNTSGGMNEDCNDGTKSRVEDNIDEAVK